MRWVCHVESNVRHFHWKRSLKYLRKERDASRWRISLIRSVNSTRIYFHPYLTSVLFEYDCFFFLTNQWSVQNPYGNKLWKVRINRHSSCAFNDEIIVLFRPATRTCSRITGCSFEGRSSFCQFDLYRWWLFFEKDFSIALFSLRYTSGTGFIDWEYLS